MAVATVLYDLATEGLAVITNALETAGLGTPGRMHVSAGPPALDDCCDGWLTAWPSALYMSEPFPTEAPYARGACAAELRAAEFTFQYAICVPTLTNQGKVPARDDLDASGLQGAVGMLALHRGLGCWVGMLTEADLDAYMLGRVEPDEPSGACASWSGQVVVDIESCACPTGTLS